MINSTVFFGLKKFSQGIQRRKSNLRTGRKEGSKEGGKHRLLFSCDCKSMISFFSAPTVEESVRKRNNAIKMEGKRKKEKKTFFQFSVLKFFFSFLSFVFGMTTATSR